MSADPEHLGRDNANALQNIYERKSIITQYYAEGVDKYKYLIYIYIQLYTYLHIHIYMYVFINILYLYTYLLYVYCIILHALFFTYRPISSQSCFTSRHVWRDYRQPKECFDSMWWTCQLQSPTVAAECRVSTYQGLDPTTQTIPIFWNPALAKAQRCHRDRYDSWSPIVLRNLVPKVCWSLAWAWKAYGVMRLCLPGHKRSWRSRRRKMAAPERCRTYRRRGRSGSKWLWPSDSSVFVVEFADWCWFVDSWQHIVD